MWNKLRGAWGFYSYVLNDKTKEAHKKGSKKYQCHLDFIKRKVYLSKRKFKSMLKAEEIDGCHFCNKEADNG